MSIEVTLNQFELALAAQVGCWRNQEALRQGRPDAHGRDDSSGWSDHIEGAAGELAFAKATRRYWDATVNTFKVGADVGMVQVRTRRMAWYDLIIRPDARDLDPYVLVTGTAPTFRVVGWCYASDARRYGDAYCQRFGGIQHPWSRDHGDRPAALFVPQSALRDPTELCAGAAVLATGLAPCLASDGRYPPTPVRG